MVVQRSRHVPLTQVFLGSAPCQAWSHFALDLAVHPFLGVTWSQTAFQCPWPRRGLTAAHKLEHRAYGDLTPFPWACLGDKYEVYCLSRFLRLPRGGYCYLVWILLYSWSWPFCWHPHIQPRCSVSARAWGTVKPDTIFFHDCNCRSLLAESCSQSDQRLSKLPFPFSFLSRTHTHTPTPSQSQHVDLNSLWWSLQVQLPTVRSKGTAKGWGNQAAFLFCQYFHENWNREKEYNETVKKQASILYRSAVLTIFSLLFLFSFSLLLNFSSLKLYNDTVRSFAQKALIQKTAWIFIIMPR